MIDPFPFPLAIVGGKFDIYQVLECSVIYKVD